jgi:hypothetical protein
MGNREDPPEEGLVKVRIDLPDASDPLGESFWAEPLGGDRYQLRTTPWYARNLHFLDIVRAVPQAPEEWPTLQEVLERSGHQTIRVLFRDEVNDATIEQVLQHAPLRDRCLLPGRPPTPADSPPALVIADPLARFFWP